MRGYAARTYGVFWIYEALFFSVLLQYIYVFQIEITLSDECLYLRSVTNW